jgi:hypothetical protein
MNPRERERSKQKQLVALHIKMKQPVTLQTETKHLTQLHYRFEAAARLLALLRVVENFS